MNKVLGGLFLGNYRDSKDVAQIQRHRITHILSIHDAPKRHFPEKEYLCIMASDSTNQNLSQYFSTCNDFIHIGRTTPGGNVLIHCLAGMSRSVTIAIAYLLSITSFTLSEAEKIVRGARPVSNPNSGFMKQLQEFESSSRLFEERRRMLETYPGSTFFDGDAEYCKKHLASYNHLIAHQHPIKTSPRKIPPTPQQSKFDSAENVAASRESLSGTAGPSRRKASSTPNSPAIGDSGGPMSRTRSTRSSRTHPMSRSTGGATPPEPTPPWERHYGCWKEHFRAKNSVSGGSPLHSNSTPPSPVHYKVTRTHSRTDSMTSVTSVTSLPAHLTSTPINTPLVARRPSTTSGIESQSPERRRPGRRQLPQPKPRYPPSARGSRELNVGEEEDETLAVVLVSQPVVPAPNPSSSHSIQRNKWPVAVASALPPTIPELRLRGHQVDKSRSLTARASLGITRWVMKRSGAFRYAMDNS